ncbi:acyltransferase family protein [Prochlorococcus marinus]|uniref:acyltransferase family protein n=1 Tax=Prochlorococcus marinus TaxID=1219 RepID=UPI001ADCCB51|nr:acyltransferase family protein [Prochlorococcus marinus]MBO8217710.1 acyltransferase [Prochlorococcus marinus XMU1405]
MNNTNLIKSKYRNEIDGLRAFAVIAVIINHFNKNILPGGYLGVDIFFVISGYVITSSLAWRKNKNFQDFLISFFERRIKRLIPALIPFTLITGVLICFFNPFPLITLRTGITSLFGLSNFYLLKQSTDYFAESTQFNAFTHTWSLDLEEQFYFLFPFLIWFSGFGKQSKNGIKNLFITIIFLIFLSLSSYIIISRLNPSAAYFLMPTRFWEMAAGCLTFLILKSNKKFTKKLTNLNPLIIFLLIVIVLSLPINFSVLATISIVFLTSLLICCLKRGSNIFNFFVNKKVLHIGKMSYSLYLWHWSVLCISRFSIGVHFWSVPFQLAIIYLISLASYKWIEEPFRNKVWSLYKWKTILKGILLLIFSGSFLFIFENPLKGKLYLGRDSLDNGNEITNNWRDNIYSVKKEINGKVCHGEKSYSEKDMLNIFEKCIIYNPQNKNGRTVAFVGDSHNLTLMKSQKLVFNEGNNLINYSFNGCPFPYPENGLKPKECDRYLKLATNKILKFLSKNDVVVIYNYHLSHLGDNSLRDVRHNLYDKNGNLPSEGEAKFQIYKNTLINFSKKADQKGIKIIFVGATMRNNLLKISSKEWFRPFPPKYVLKEEKRNAINLNNKFKESLESIDNIKFIDPINEINCCRDIEEYNIYFRPGDTDHLSELGAETLMRKILYFITNENYLGSDKYKKK